VKVEETATPRTAEKRYAQQRRVLQSPACKRQHVARRASSSHQRYVRQRRRWQAEPAHPWFQDALSRAYPAPIVHGEENKRYDMTDKIAAGIRYAARSFSGR